MRAICVECRHEVKDHYARDRSDIRAIKYGCNHCRCVIPDDNEHSKPYATETVR